MKTKDFESYKNFFGSYTVENRKTRKTIEWSTRCHKACDLVRKLQEEKDIQDREYLEEKGDAI